MTVRAAPRWTNFWTLGEVYNCLRISKDTREELVKISNENVGFQKGRKTILSESDLEEHGEYPEDPDENPKNKLSAAWDKFSDDAKKDLIKSNHEFDDEFDDDEKVWLWESRWI